MDYGEIMLEFNCSKEKIKDFIGTKGKMPLPPYILKKRKSSEDDFIDYQTVYAKNEGSIAAPTAGLHFNKSIIQQLKDNNQNIDLITGDSKLLIRSFQSLGKSNYLVGALSNASKGDLIGPLKTPRGYGLVSIVDISPIDSSDFEMKRDVIYNNLANQKRNSNFQSWYQDLLDRAKIIDNRKYYF